MWWILIFCHILEYWIISFRPNRDIENITNVILCSIMFWKSKVFFHWFNAFILLNIYWFYWRFVLKILLNLHAVMTCILLNLPVTCYLETAPMTCHNVVGCFITMLRINILFILLEVDVLFHVLLLFTGKHMTCWYVHRNGQIYQCDYP